MCDTLVALANATEDGSVIFGKNSDRPPNEAQVIRRFPGMRHGKGETVKCTYLEIPQVSETYEVLLSCPFWIWGAEMGTNEWGVAIGNEAVWSKEEYADTGLLGMDLLRLGLERGQSAVEALDIITQLLEAYGQGGNCFFNESLKYHNSFIIADSVEAWVLETADRHWVAQQVQDVRSISNGYTIGRQWDLASAGVVENAIDKGWCLSKKDFDFADCYGDGNMEAFMHCCERTDRSQELLEDHKGRINVPLMMGFLKDHEGYTVNNWNPDKQEHTLCMHAGPDVMSHSTASYVGHLKKEAGVHWMTGGSTPCLSAYIPFFIGTQIPEIFTRGGEKFNDNSFWWSHEKLVRKVQQNYHNLASSLQSDLEAIQKDFLKEANGLSVLKTDFSTAEDILQLEGFSKNCTEKLNEKTRQWIESLYNLPKKKSKNTPYVEFLKELNKAVDMDF